MRLQGGPLHVGWRCREHLVYVCVQPSGRAFDVPTVAAKPLSILFYPHRGGYLFDDPVTCLMTRLPGYVFEVGSNRFIKQVTASLRGFFCLKQVTSADNFYGTVQRVTRPVLDPAVPADKDPAIPAFRVARSR